jgi:hypothetical protein
MAQWENTLVMRLIVEKLKKLKEEVIKLLTEKNKKIKYEIC